ncbi:TonB-dependent receptor [Mangrovimicrobium sediminis]|uniref:TonB-dependent receptor n=1 Tax=Mangrovimicrobium sediminis TaxID=2562682 RepID=UPI00197DF6C8|nr:TonB-dependent receptor [Haliea sp. SAOS-164]
MHAPRLLTCAIAAVLAVPVYAQSQLEEVVVTAQRRAEASRDVPITVTTLSSEQLATANITTLSDTAKLTPGLRFDTQGPSMQPTIRGVGTAITTSGGGPNVGIYVDGFFQANSYVADFDLLRVKNVQVLKGPQGTLFGRNTTGGAIIVTTDDPSTETAAEARLTYGSYNRQVAQGYATFGLADNVAMDIEGMYRTGDGYFDDKLSGDDKIGEYESWSVRLGLKWDISDDVSLLLRYTKTDKDDPTTQLTNAFVDDGDAGFLSQVSAAGRAVYGVDDTRGLPLVYFYAPFAVPVPTKPGDVALNPPVEFKTESDIYQATVKADLGFALLTSYTQYREDSSPYYADLDATAIPIFNLYVGPDDESFSQEFILASNTDSALQWTAGLNYYEIEDTWDVDASFGGAPFFDYGGSTTTTKSWAAFVDATYQVSDNWFVTLGGRYSDDRVEDASFDTNPFTFFYEGPNGEFIPFTGAPGTVIPVDDLKNDDFTPRIVLRYTPTDDSSIYASYTEGYKAGILNVGGLSQKPVEPEEIEAWEVGYKFDNRVLALELAGYYYDYKNLQVSSYQSGAAQIRNAASSEIYGLDAQLRWQVSGDFSVYSGVAWTHARYESFTNAPYYSYCDPTADATSLLFCLPAELGGLGAGSLVQSLTDASDGEMQRAPEWTGNLGASYDIPLGGSLLTLSGNIYYTSEFYFDPEQQFRQEDYTLVSLRGQWTDASGRYTVAVFGDNVTDEDYRTQVLFNTLGIGSVWGAPATWGISLGMNF